MYPSLLTKSPERDFLCYKLEVSTVLDTVRQGLEDLVSCFMSERNQNSDKVYCPCKGRDSLYPSKYKKFDRSLRYGRTRKLDALSISADDDHPPGHCTQEHQGAGDEQRLHHPNREVVHHAFFEQDASCAGK